MSEPHDRRDDPIEFSDAMPWQVLLCSLEQSAAVIAAEVMGDLVLGESVTTSVSAYVTQREKLAVLREDFAQADAFCASLRVKAREHMQMLGYDFEWTTDDLRAVDEQLAMNMKAAADNAADINKKRAAASMLHHQLLERAIDEIALCASIGVLREVSRYSGEGEAFCVAYAATALLREQSINDLPMKKAINALSDWMQYAIGVKTRAVEFDIFAHSRIAAAIGRGMGIENTGALCLALIDAMKKGSTSKEA
jgi:hypothetical protein